MGKTVVIALGGNAILKQGQMKASEQYENVKKACEQIAKIIERGYRVIITHGNGSQIGFLLLQNEMAKKQVPPMPLDVLGAESQGQIGYLIQQLLKNQLMKKMIDKDVVTLVTQVLVDADDPAFKHPTKPIGPFYGKKEAEAMEKEDHEMRKDPRDGYRKVVASPEPLEIVEKDVIKSLVKAGVIVIATGGGGIPVIKAAEGLKGVEAVIDKDLTAEKIAEAIGAEILLNLTDVDKVALNYGKPNQKNLDRMTLSEAKQYMQAGHFPPGSMGPKIAAAIKHIDAGGERAIIASIPQATAALDGKAGTTITR